MKRPNEMEQVSAGCVICFCLIKPNVDKLEHMDSKVIINKVIQTEQIRLLHNMKNKSNYSQILKKDFSL